MFIPCWNSMRMPDPVADEVDRMLLRLSRVLRISSRGLVMFLSTSSGEEEG